MQRPNFQDIKSYQEFVKYYWYLEELKQICKDAGIECSGTKSELNHYIEEYFKGNVIKKSAGVKRLKSATDILTLDTKLIECGFCFSNKFREFFSRQTGIANFKFNADMVATSKKVKQDNDIHFTLKDMLDIYYGKKEYAKYDNSSCQWNRFLKDFCADENNSGYNNKLKAASVLWNEVRNSTKEKVYTKDLVKEYFEKIKDY